MNMNKFISMFEGLISNIMGDFNFDFLLSDKKKSVEFLINNINMNQIIKEPTHIQNSLLDQVYVSKHFLDRLVKIKHKNVHYSGHDAISMKFTPFT